MSHVSNIEKINPDNTTDARVREVYRLIRKFLFAIGIIVGYGLQS